MESVVVNKQFKAVNVSTNKRFFASVWCGNIYFHLFSVITASCCFETNWSSLFLCVCKSYIELKNNTNNTTAPISKRPGTKATKHQCNAALKMTAKCRTLYNTSVRKHFTTYRIEACCVLLFTQSTVIYWCIYVASELICSLYCCIVAVFDTL